MGKLPGLKRSRLPLRRELHPRLVSTVTRTTWYLTRLAMYACVEPALGKPTLPG